MSVQKFPFSQGSRPHGTSDHRFEKIFSRQRAAIFSSTNTTELHDDEIPQSYRQIVERDIQFVHPNWKTVSSGAQDFILRLLQVRPGDRLTADSALGHPWLRRATQSFCHAGSLGTAGYSSSVVYN